LILVWSLLLLARPPGAQPARENCGLNPHPPIPVVGQIKRLDPVTFAGLDSFSQTSINKLKEDIPKQAPQGGVLFLIGSTDCTHFSKGNMWLADKRASKVSDDLGEIPDVSIKTPYDLPQHERCKPTAELRAVFPYIVPFGPDGK
jgi:hypothetical protein